MSGWVAFLAHCLLNPLAKIQGSSANETLSKKVLETLLENRCGMIQLPCPELLHGGLARWGQTRSQYNSVFFRKHCQNLAEAIADQAEEYRRHNVVLGPLIGIEGSPSCGLSQTCDGRWGGELSQSGDLAAKMDTLQMVPGPGVFMEVLRQTLANRSINLFEIGIEEGNAEKSLEKLRRYLNSCGK